MLVSSRSFREYVSMFELKPEDLTQRILDCGAGAASFTAAQRALSRPTFATDPIYAMPFTELMGIVRDGVEETRQNIRREPNRYDWSGNFRSPAEHGDERAASAETFLADYRSGPSAYLASSVYELPFRDRTVDLVLSSHLLFTHASDVSPTMHIQAVSEMLRITRREVRIFPLVGFQADATDALEAVLKFALDMGTEVVQRPASYRFMAGADQMLRLLKV